MSQTAARALSRVDRFLGRAGDARPQAGYESFEAARADGFRGWFYFPHLDAPNLQLDRLTRLEIAKKSNWLYNNLGVAKSIINRSSRYEAGLGLWPKPRTARRDWNRLVADRFHQGVKDARFFDLAATDNFYTAQQQVRRHIKLHGDYFAQRIVAGSGRMMMRFIPSYAIGNAVTDLDQSLWVDGVRRNVWNRPVQYRLLKNRERTDWADLSSDDVMHLRDPGWSGQARGEGILAHACRHLFDIDDILRFEKNGVKLTSQIGYVISVPPEAGASGSGPQFNLPGATATETVKNDDGTEFTIQKIFNGEGSAIPEMKRGAKLELVESKRPGTAFTGFLDYLIRDVCWGCEYPPEFQWFLAGIGGAPMRFILEDVQTVIDDKRENQLKVQFCRPFYTAWLWQEIQSERIEYPGDDWWRADWLSPKRVTVDKGREGRLDDDRLATGKTSPRIYFGELGLDEEEVEDDIIDAYFRRVKKVADRAATEQVDATYRDIFLPPPGSANTVTVVDPNAAGDATPTE